MALVTTVEMGLMGVSRFRHWARARHLEDVLLPNVMLLQPDHGLPGNVLRASLPVGSHNGGYELRHDCNISINSNFHIAWFELRDLDIWIHEVGDRL